MNATTRCIVGLGLCVLGGVAMAGQVSLADLARHTQYKMVKISPDGTHIAATSVLANGQTVLSLIDIAAHKVVNIAPRGGDDVQDFWWISPKHVVYNETLHLGGWDQPMATGELYSVEADGGSPSVLYGFRMEAMQAGSLLQHAAKERGSARFLARIQGDPDSLLVTITDWEASGSSGNLNAVYRMDVRTGVKRSVATAPMREADFLADHQGRVRFTMADDPNGGRLIYMRPPEGGAWELLQQASEKRSWPIAFNADDSFVWFACSGVPDGIGICKFDPATRRMTHVWSNTRVAASGLAQGLAEDSVIGIEYTDGRPSTALLDGDAPAARTLVGLMRQFPGEVVRFVSGSADGSKAIVLVEADVDPGTFYLYDRDHNSLAPLLQRAQWIDPNQLGRAQPFTFTTRDGLSEQGYVTYPPGKDNARDLPMVVFVHGGPYGIRDWWAYDPYVQALATRGYAVLQVNYRGSGGYGFGFEKAGWLQWGGKMQDDVTDATRWAIAQGIADKDRICIYGGSYGGYAALEGAVSVPDLYKCAIGYVGVYDLRLMYTRGDIPQNIYGKDYLKRVLGTDAGELARRSPVNQLDGLKAKVMLIVGGADRRVPPVQGQNLHKALDARRIAHEWLYEPGEGHGFYNQQNITELFQKVDAFLAANIGPGAGVAKGAAVSATVKDLAQARSYDEPL